MLQSRYLARWLGACVVLMLSVCWFTDFAAAQVPVSTAEAAPLQDSKADELIGGNLGYAIKHFKYLAIVGVLLACGMGLPLPEEVPILTSAVLARLGVLDPWYAIAALVVGVMLGDSVMFLMGCRWGPKLLEHRFAQRMLPIERREKILHYFAKYGAWIIFAARFMPGLRAPLFLTSGTMGVRFWVFFGMDGAAMLVSVPTSFAVAYYFTDQLEQALEAKEHVQHYAFGALAVFVIGGLLIKKWWHSRQPVEVTEAPVAK